MFAVRAVLAYLGLSSITNESKPALFSAGTSTVDSTLNPYFKFLSIDTLKSEPEVVVCNRNGESVSCMQITNDEYDAYLESLEMAAPAIYSTATPLHSMSINIIGEVDKEQTKQIA
ncbi:MAG: hypothetical protein Q7U57_15265 [Methylovulum sp.]|nr:hypothetical protein [Methylovulum sp.]